MPTLSLSLFLPTVNSCQVRAVQVGCQVTQSFLNSHTREPDTNPRADELAWASSPRTSGSGSSCGCGCG